MKRLCTGCFGLLFISIVIVAVIFWWCRPEGRPLAPDEVKGYDYSATTASGAVLSSTSTLSFGNSTTSVQKADSSETFRSSAKPTPHKASIWRTLVDRLFSINHSAKGEPVRDEILIFINLTLILGGLIWLSFYTAEPFSLRIVPLMNFLGGAVIGASVVWGSKWITILLGIAVFYGLTKLYEMPLKNMFYAIFMFFAIPTVIILFIYLEFLLVYSLFGY